MQAVSSHCPETPLFCTLVIYVHHRDPPVTTKPGFLPRPRFLQKPEEMGLCAGPGGDPLLPARRGCAVHQGNPPAAVPARRPARTARRIVPDGFSYSTCTHLGRFAPAFWRAEVCCLPGRCGFKARRRSRNAPKTRGIRYPEFSGAVPIAPAGLEPAHKGVFRNAHLRGPQGDIPGGHDFLCNLSAHTPQRHGHFAH